MLIDPTRALSAGFGHTPRTAKRAVLNSGLAVPQLCPLREIESWNSQKVRRPITAGTPVVKVFRRI